MISIKTTLSNLGTGCDEIFFLFFLFDEIYGRLKLKPRKFQIGNLIKNTYNSINSRSQWWIDQFFC